MADMTDHDLLIRLDARLESLEKSQRTAWEGFNERILSILEVIKSKAEKSEVEEMKNKMNDLNARTMKLEEREKKEDIQKQMVINLGAGGVKVWQFVVGAILFFISVIAFLNSMIDAIKN